MFLSLSRFEAFPDRLTPEQILAQAQDAAKDAKEQLSIKKPNTKVFGKKYVCKYIQHSGENVSQSTIC